MARRTPRRSRSRAHRAASAASRAGPAGAGLRRYPRPPRLAEPLVPPGRLERGLEAPGIATYGALLEHLPRGHVEREARAVASLQPGEKAAVAVEVRSVSVRPMRN